MRVVVFGNGHWGQNYVRELADNLVAVVEPNAERAAMVVGVPCYPELSDLNFDAAVIATPPSTHVGLALPILESGRYVLIEKPLALHVGEASLLLPYSNRCMVMDLYAHHPVMHEMRCYVQEYGLDHIFTRRTNHGPIRSWQNALWDLASHDVAILNRLLPERAIVRGLIGNRNWSMLTLQYGNVTTASYVSWLGRPKQRVVELVSHDNEERFVFDDVNTQQAVPPLTRVLNEFKSGSWDRCTLEEGIAVVDVLEEASAIQGGCRCQ